MAEISPNFGDREIMEDVLASQRQMTAEYNAAANQCASSALQSEFMTLLGEEQQIQMELFQECRRPGSRRSPRPGSGSPAPTANRPGPSGRSGQSPRSPAPTEWGGFSASSAEHPPLSFLYEHFFPFCAIL